MSTSSVQSTAQIIQFPVGGRKALVRHPQAGLAGVGAGAAGASPIGDAWYHQAAIEESKLVGGH